MLFQVTITTFSITYVLQNKKFSPSKFLKSPITKSKNIQTPTPVPRAIKHCSDLTLHLFRNSFPRKITITNNNPIRFTEKESIKRSFPSCPFQRAGLETLTLNNPFHCNELLRLPRRCSDGDAESSIPLDLFALRSPHGL